jgi:hypothetical protein
MDHYSTFSLKRILASSPPHTPRGLKKAGSPDQRKELVTRDREGRLRLGSEGQGVDLRLLASLAPGDIEWHNPGTFLFLKGSITPRPLEQLLL